MHNADARYPNLRGPSPLHQSAVVLVVQVRDHPGEPALPGGTAAAAVVSGLPLVRLPAGHSAQTGANQAWSPLARRLSCTEVEQSAENERKS